MNDEDYRRLLRDAHERERRQMYENAQLLGMTPFEYQVWLRENGELGDFLTQDHNRATHMTYNEMRQITRAQQYEQLRHQQEHGRLRRYGDWDWEAEPDPPESGGTTLREHLINLRDRMLGRTPDDEPVRPPAQEIRGETVMKYEKKITFEWDD